MTAATETIPRVTDVLEHARATVLETGTGLDEQSVLGVLTLEQERLGEALALAHEVRMRWCGPEVEVEGILSRKTGGCPEDCHFCSQSARFDTPVGPRRSTRVAASRRRARRRRSAPPSSASSRPCAGPTSG